MTCFGAQAAGWCGGTCRQVEELCSKAVIALLRGPRRLEGRGLEWASCDHEALGCETSFAGGAEGRGGRLSVLALPPQLLLAFLSRHFLCHCPCQRSSPGRPRGDRGQPSGSAGNSPLAKWEGPGLLFPNEWVLAKETRGGPFAHHGREVGLESGEAQRSRTEHLTPVDIR